MSGWQTIDERDEFGFFAARSSGRNGGVYVPTIWIPGIDSVESAAAASPQRPGCRRKGSVDSHDRTDRRHSSRIKSGP